MTEYFYLFYQSKEVCKSKFKSDVVDMYLDQIETTTNNPDDFIITNHYGMELTKPNSNEEDK